MRISMKPTVIVMLKAPRIGEVKTRLGREIGSLAALNAYRRLVEHQLRQIPKEWLVQVAYAPVDAEPEMRAWLGNQTGYFAQHTGDLGQRLAAASQLHFSRSAAPLIFVGGDCPHLTREYLLQIERLFTGFDAVLAPANDGGYCLIGLRAANDRVFENIDWSTAAVLEQTRERLREMRALWVEAETVEDVDDLASWKRAIAAFPELITPIS
jgi:rSAM/selenodomain-associated transferase 1